MNSPASFVKLPARVGRAVLPPSRRAIAPLRRDGGCPAGTSITLDTTLIHYSNLTLLASFHHTPHTIRRALEFIETGAVRAADFVDGESPLTQLPELFKSMVAGNHGIKTLIRVQE
jgi:L-iditol 2-dehydrogenase